METINKSGLAGAGASAMGCLAGQRVIVLGGSSGIGLATAKAAVLAGAQVTIVSGNQQRLDAAMGELAAVRAEGAEGGAGVDTDGVARSVQVDLSQEERIKDFFESIGTFDHLVYTAGENLRLAELAGNSLEAARQFWQIRYWGAYASVKYGAPHIRMGGSVNLSSGIASSRPGKGWTVASSICGAMEGLTRALAVELAPIRVNCVKPGVVKTPLWDSMANPEQLYASSAEALLLKRVGEPENIAQAFMYLMTQPYGTGQALVIDGGAELV